MWCSSKLTRQIGMAGDREGRTRGNIIMSTGRIVNGVLFCCSCFSEAANALLTQKCLPMFWDTSFIDMVYSEKVGFVGR